MNRRGFFYADALVGLFLLGSIAGVVTIAESGYQRFSRAQANERTATRHAEQAIAALQAGRLPAAELNATVIPLRDEAPPGTRWIRVEAVERDRRVALVALLEDVK